MMSMREMVIEYILFAFSDEELMERFRVLADEVPDLPDQDLLEMYDMTLLTELQHEDE